jgi:hypothetical protein
MSKRTLKVVFNRASGQLALFDGVIELERYYHVDNFSVVEYSDANYDPPTLARGSDFRDPAYNEDHFVDPVNPADAAGESMGERARVSGAF